MSRFLLMAAILSAASVLSFGQDTEEGAKGIRPSGDNTVIRESAKVAPGAYRIVQSWADKELAEAAGDVIAKVEAVVPEALRKYMTNTALLAPSMHYMEPISFDLAELRNALRDQHKVSIDYRDAHGDETSRDVRPLSLAYFGPVWVMTGSDCPASCCCTGTETAPNWSLARTGNCRSN